MPETAGWWIDVHPPETHDALSRSPGSQLASLAGQHEIDKGLIFGHDREVVQKVMQVSLLGRSWGVGATVTV